MVRREELHVAAAICAAVVGAGFASGREIEAFFTRLGAGSWLGVVAACAGLGLLTYVLVTLAQHTRAASFPDLYGRLMDSRCRYVMHLFFGLLTLITAAAMIAAGGELCALAFDWHEARMIGCAAVLLAGVALAALGVSALGRLGLAMAVCIAGVYTALALSQRAATSSSFSVEGLAAAVPMGLLYAAFNGALAGGVTVAAAKEGVRPAQTGLLVAAVMLAMFVPANTALLRCDDQTRRMALPTVAMAACWGVAGYYIVIVLMLLAVLTTLGAMLSSLRDQATALGLPRPAALLLPAATALLMSVCGFETLVNVVYPLLGWVCAFALLSLVFCWPDNHVK